MNPALFVCMLDRIRIDGVIAGSILFDIRMDGEEPASG
jgi:hypothetical protein